MDDGSIIEDFLRLEMIDNTTYVFVNCDKSRVVVLRDPFQRCTCDVRIGGSKFVLRGNKALWLPRIAFQIIVEGERLGYRKSVVQIEMKARAAQRTR